MKGQKPKGYYPKGHIGDGDGCLRGIGCLGFFVIFILLLVAGNLPL